MDKAVICAATQFCQQFKESIRAGFVRQRQPLTITTGIGLFRIFWQPQVSSPLFTDHHGFIVQQPHPDPPIVAIGFQQRTACLGYRVITQIDRFGETPRDLEQPGGQFHYLITTQVEEIQIRQTVKTDGQFRGMGIAQKQVSEIQHLADIDGGTQPIAAEPQGTQCAHVGQFAQRVLGKRYPITVQPQMLKVRHV
ncbi:hypothetical protein D3C72_1381780 [compost metagenome]